ncbi:MAG: glycosyltransferase family 2 protein, partial [Candidatus Daviesbacteria bacterium]|nr:glycosyltransferase family 2 protein [Candidatus Daviesbacteria bacterium]
MLVFFIGFLSFFYFSEIFRRVFKGFRYSFLGITLAIIGLLIGFLGQTIFSGGINVLIGFFLVGAGLGLVIHHLLSQRFILFEKTEREFVLKHENGFERFLEILPGSLTWLALTSPIWLSFTLPYAMAYLILIADVYWLLTAFRIAILILIGYRKMEYVKKQDWQSFLRKDFPGSSEKYYQLILVPTYKEALYILEPTINGIINSTYPKKKIFIAVGFEERDDPEKIEETKNFLKKIEVKIAGVFTSIHPYGLPGEVAGQGSNKNWMIKHIMPEFQKRGIETEDVFVTTLDADFVVHRQFLSGALHKYLSLPTAVRDKRTFTGVFLYHNNYWQTPTPMRLMATGTSFWQMAEMVGSDKYMNYSSMSISLKALLDIGLWIPDKVNDDNG